MGSNPYSYIPIPYPNWIKINSNKAIHYFEQKEENVLEINWLLYGMFQVDWEELGRLEYIMVKDVGLSLSDLDKMEYYRFQYFIENHKQRLEDEEKRQKDQENGDSSKFNMEQSMKSQQQGMAKQMGNYSMPKMPSMPNFKR